MANVAEHSTRKSGYIDPGFIVSTSVVLFKGKLRNSEKKSQKGLSPFVLVVPLEGDLAAKYAKFIQFLEESLKDEVSSRKII